MALNIKHICNNIKIANFAFKRAALYGIKIKFSTFSNNFFRYLQCEAESGELFNISTNASDEAVRL